MTSWIISWLIDRQAFNTDIISLFILVSCQYMFYSALRGFIAKSYYST